MSHSAWDYITETKKFVIIWKFDIGNQKFNLDDLFPLVNIVMKKYNTIKGNLNIEFILFHALLTIKLSGTHPPTVCPFKTRPNGRMKPTKQFFPNLWRATTRCRFTCSAYKKSRWMNSEAKHSKSSCNISIEKATQRFETDLPTHLIKKLAKSQAWNRCYSNRPPGEYHHLGVLLGALGALYGVLQRIMEAVENKIPKELKLKLKASQVYGIPISNTIFSEFFPMLFKVLGLKWFWNSIKKNLDIRFYFFVFLEDNLY